MNIAIVGSREFDNYDNLRQVMYLLYPSPEMITSIVSGGARGADKLAERFAAEHGLPVQVFKADWDTWDVRAGYMRNITIVNTADEVVAFWNGKSKGTRHTIDLAEKNHKLREVVIF